MKVIVVGCGPAGLAAAHAAIGHGCEVVVCAPKKRTPQEGPLLIQRPIPGINNNHPDGTIHQRVIGGSILDYRYKLYGDINIGINGDILRPEYHAWNHRETYSRLWALYNDLIQDRKLLPPELSRLHLKCDLVVSTASAWRMCMIGHRFESARVYVTPNASYPDQPVNTIIFNAGSEYGWVRSSDIFDVGVTEWLPAMARGFPPVSGGRMVTKPISTNCNCYPHILRTGRFGAWKNETWVDTAYWDTYTAIASMLRKDELDTIK